ncbi:MAG: hypothetical protein ACFCUX_08755 [Candidatus Methylacidiphilales bacterium]
MKRIEQIEWQFGGWLSEVDPIAGWLILTLMMLGSVAGALISYRHSLRKLSWNMRVWLVTLRSALLFILFLCLANPSRVEKDILAGGGEKKIAVVVDVSDSMTLPDNRKRSRLEHVSHQWKKWQGEIKENFSELRFYHMAEQTVATDHFPHTLNPAVQTADTGFFQSIDSILSSGEPSWDAILYLTDALDTRGDEATKNSLIQRARAHHVPVYFIPGVNRLEGRPYLSVEEVIVPQRIVQRSRFEYEVILKMNSDTARTIPLKLYNNDQLIAEDKLGVGSGQSVRKWETQIVAGAPGAMRLRLEVGEGKNTGRALSEVQVLPRLPRKVLFYMGALDWGYRYFSDALAQDPSYELSTIFSPAMGLQVSSMAAGSPILSAFPQTPAALDIYDLVVLSHVYSEDLSPVQQRVLAAYVRGGGAVLFIMSNSKGSREYAGSVVEEMLPVVLGVSETAGTDEMAREFQNRMQRERSKMSNQKEAEFAALAAEDQMQFPLSALTLVEGSDLAAFFKTLPQDPQSWIPRFYERAVVEYAKAGARVQAMQMEPAQKEILFATQSFGSGKASLLATDMFWRWHLSHPSDGKKLPIFWQYFVSWLSRSAESGLRFTHAPQTVAASSTVTFKLAGGRDPLRAVCRNVQDGNEFPVETQGADAEGNHEIVLRPPRPGDWSLHVRELDTSHYANAFFHVTQSPGFKETDPAPADLDLMREIALQTGGEVLQNRLPGDWKRGSEHEVVVREHQTLLWHQGWLLGLMGAFYVGELVLRRRAKLL